MKELKKQKGITLVALIITIVVLLILAAVAIGAVKDSNIIGHAQNAAGSFNQAKENEISLLEKYEKEIEDKLPKSEEIIWGEYQGMLMYIGTSNDLKVTSDTIQVQEITFDEETMEYTKVEGKIKQVKLSAYAMIILRLNPNLETIDLGNKLSSNCIVDGYNLKKLIKLSGLGGIETIQEGAFLGCENLKEVVIPEGVTTIESQAFDSCYNLTKIILPSTLTSISPMNFGGDVTITRPPMEITINMTREKAETTLGTEWIPSSAKTIIYTDTTVTL